MRTIRAFLLCYCWSKVSDKMWEESNYSAVPCSCETRQLLISLWRGMNQFSVVILWQLEGNVAVRKWAKIRLLSYHKFKEKIVWPWTNMWSVSVRLKTDKKVIPTALISIKLSVIPLINILPHAFLWCDKAFLLKSCFVRTQKSRPSIKQCKQFGRNKSFCLTVASVTFVAQSSKKILSHLCVCIR